MPRRWCSTRLTRLLAGDRHWRRLDQGEGRRLVLVHGGRPTASPVPPDLGDLHRAGRRRRHGDGYDRLSGDRRQRPRAGMASAAVDDDGLTGGNAASMIGDLAPISARLPLDTDEAIYTGTLGGSVGPRHPRRNLQLCGLAQRADRGYGRTRDGELRRRRQRADRDDRRRRSARRHRPVHGPGHQSRRPAPTR